MESDTSKLYSIMLDIQKQVGDLSRETGEQTEKLISIEEQTKKTNGRVTALEGKVEKLQILNANSIGQATIKTAVMAGLAGVGLTILASIITKHLGL